MTNTYGNDALFVSKSPDTPRMEMYTGFTTNCGSSEENVSDRGSREAYCCAVEMVDTTCASVYCLSSECTFHSRNCENARSDWSESTTISARWKSSRDCENLSGTSIPTSISDARTASVSSSSQAPGKFVTVNSDENASETNVEPSRSQTPTRSEELDASNSIRNMPATMRGSSRNAKNCFFLVHRTYHSFASKPVNVLSSLMRT